MLVKHLWRNDGTQHQQRDSWNLNKKLSIDCCIRGGYQSKLYARTTSNTQKRMKTGKRYFKNNTLKKEYWPLHFIQENRLWKNTVAQMNQLKSTPHPGHDGISLSSMTMPHSEQIFFMKRTNDINIKVSPVIIDTKKLIGMKRLMASMIRPKTNKMIPRLHFFKPEFIWGIS